MSSVDALLQLVAEHDELACLEGAERRAHLRGVLAGVVEQEDLDHECDRVERALFGFGPLEGLFSDEAITDVLVDGPCTIRVERDGRIEETDICFSDHDELVAFARRLVVRAGARIDQQQPIADGVMPGGERVHVVLPPIAPDGPVISIRRHAARPLSLADLVARSMLTSAQAERLVSLVTGRAAVAISGGTGTGKTTLLRCLIALARDDRIVVIEETPEIGRPTPRVVGLVARGPNLEGKGAIDLAALVHAGLRMRPDRIVIGEVRGAEAAAALWAMSTGHRGSMLTVHASDAGAVPTTLARLAGPGCAESDFARHLDVVVHLERRGDRRVVAAIEEP
ncbi:MAG TPA: ATPase, T2SS/T4P/T4SS family [Actinomycetota bacterium]|nr:ATPase, T2SS/T4P/T4SS family [Actinomycetota bacterium]